MDEEEERTYNDRSVASREKKKKKTLNISRIWFIPREVDLLVPALYYKHSFFFKF